MAINIQGLTPGQNGATKTRQNEAGNEVKPSPEKAGTDTAGQKEDAVQLSDRAQVLRTVQSKVQDMPDIDQEKVDRIKTAIENGDYNIDYDRLAAAFRRFESGL